MSSVAYMDVAIGSLVTVICIVATPMLFFKSSGWPGLHAALRSRTFRCWKFESGARPRVSGSNHALDARQPGDVPEVLFREIRARRAHLRGRLDSGTLLLETLIVSIAVIGSALYPTGEVAASPTRSFLHGAPRTAGADGCAAIGAVFAKVISTASNYLFSPATNLVEDVFVRYMAPNASNKRILIVSRLAVVLLGCWALYQAVYAPAFGKDALGLYDLFCGADARGAGAFYSRRVTAWAQWRPSPPVRW